ncbi:hypothetical protein Vadar_013753 [Vaccinium darrowii]|uniref:Uncharacterized protein n=1 Tax=Vaccinium darrowii TaxID=229202 RepID=A0ACB7XRP3_9ERIC|nr:hypothetical protein Vadar_013753 [Vaccinium darrowii]
MVLDAMEGFYSANSKADKDNVLLVVRRICVALLEELMGLKPEISTEVKGRANKLAVEWRGKVSVDGKNPLEAFGFLNLVGAFVLVDEFRMEDLVEFAGVVASYEQATKLYREEARTKEVMALKFAIEIITVHELESEYPKENLERQITEQQREHFHQGLLPSLGSSPTNGSGVEASVLEFLPQLVWHQFQGLMLLPHQRVLHFSSLIYIHQICCQIILLQVFLET